MSNIENEIKELERKIALKKAYLNVGITFGKGYKAFSEEIRKEVEENLLKHARLLAEGDSKQSLTTGFTEEEIAILKGYVNAIQAKVKKPAAQPEQPKQSRFKSESTTMNSLISRATQGDAKAMKGTLMTLDSVPKEQRQKVASGAQVTVLKFNTHDSKCVVRDTQGNQFSVEKDDIDFT